MDTAHFHLLVNHFPIILTFIGLVVLLGGLLLKSSTTMNVAFFLFIIGAGFAALSMYSGEAAEHVIKQITPENKSLIHPHEENGEKLAMACYAAGLLSAIGLWFNLKNSRYAKILAYVIVVIGLAGAYFAVETGRSGGEIRHTEIRTDSTPVPAPSGEEEHKEKD